MPKMLADEGTEYDDGTVATEAQQAKVSALQRCPRSRFAALIGISRIQSSLKSDACAAIDASDFICKSLLVTLAMFQAFHMYHKDASRYDKIVISLQDVTAFLSWAAEPEHDDRKLMGVKWIFVLSLVFLTAAYYKRWKWAPIKSRRVVVDALN